MIIDLYTKTVLTIIAVATAALALGPVATGLATPAEAAAKADAQFADLATAMGSMAKDVGTIKYDIDRLVRGYCRNKKLC